MLSYLKKVYLVVCIGLLSTGCYMGITILDNIHEQNTAIERFQLSAIAITESHKDGGKAILSKEEEQLLITLENTQKAINSGIWIALLCGFTGLSGSILQLFLE